MINTEKIAVLERMRELLADPARVVLDPEHYFETDINGTTVAMSLDDALDRRGRCRVCFCGAATLAAIEIARPGEDEPLDEAVREILTAKISELEIPLDREVAIRFGWGYSPVSALTSALKQGRAVEVVDAVLADLRAAVATA